MGDDSWFLVDVPIIECGRLDGAPHAQQITLDESTFSSLEIPHAPAFMRTSEKSMQVEYEIVDDLGVVVVSKNVVDLQDLRFSHMERADGDDLQSIITVDSSLAGVSFVPAQIEQVKAGSQVESDAQNISDPDVNAWHFDAMLSRVRPMDDDSANYSGSDGDDDNCESFFLLDGRSPVDLPDSWGEARADFIALCIHEGYTEWACEKAQALVFAGKPTGYEQRMNAGPALCSRLRAYAEAMLRSAVHPNGSLVNPHVVPIPTQFSTQDSAFVAGRRMKGSGGTYSAGSGGNLRSNYPSGFRQTGYGVSGVRALPVGVPFMVHRPNYASSPNSRYGYYCSHGWSCNSSGVTNETLSIAASRDDILTQGFTPKDFQLPLRMTVYHVTGADFLTDMLCRPADELNSSTLAGQADLFVTMSAVDDGELPKWIFALLLLFSCFCCYRAVLIVFRSRSLRRDSNRAQDVELSEQDVTRSAVPLCVGQRVRTRWELEEGGDGQWYLGRITSLEGAEVTVKYDDGDVWIGSADHVFGVAEESAFCVGQRVRTRCGLEEGGDGQCHVGQIASIHGAEVTVKYDDGDVWTGSAEHVVAVAAMSSVCVGQRVRTRWELEEGGDGQWYLGRITSLDGAEVTVKYDDGDVWTGSAEHVVAVAEVC